MSPSSIQYNDEADGLDRGQTLTAATWTGEHRSVLRAEVIDGLAVRPGGRYIDGTVGLGGHAEAIMSASQPDGCLLGIDADPVALTLAEQRLRPYGARARLVQGNFGDLHVLAARHGYLGADGLLLDLGVSSLQLSAAGRGFSFQFDAPLDMRMDPALPTTAADLVNGLDEAALAELLRHYAEEPRARSLARGLVRRRPFRSTGDLAEAVKAVVGGQGGRVHPATRVFQALRIAVNHELDCLAEALPAALEVLCTGGRLAVISFHSLEDRIVKQFFQRESRDCLCPLALPVCVCTHRSRLRVLERGGRTPPAAEVAENPRSRSARLRLAERLPD